MFTKLLRGDMNRYILRKAVIILFVLLFCLNTNIHSDETIQDLNKYVELIKEKLKDGIEKQEEQTIEELCRILIKQGLEQSEDSLLNVIYRFSYESESDRLAPIIVNAVKKMPNEKIKIYNMLKKNIFPEGGFERIFIWSILQNVDKYAFFGDLMKCIIDKYNDKDRYTYYSLIKLSELRDKRIVEFLKNYNSKSIEEDIEIATAYCLVNYEYEKNFNFLLNILEEGKREKKYFVIVYDHAILSLRKIGDYRATLVLNGIQRGGLISDELSGQIDDIIKELEKEKGLIRRHKIKEITVSSTLIESSRRDDFYEVDNIFDYDINTAWVEGIECDGIREWIQFNFDKEFEVYRVDIQGGYFYTKSVYANNNRIREIEVVFSDSTKELLYFDDVMHWQQKNITPHKTKSIRFIIKDIYKGLKYRDTCISELRVWGNEIVQ